MATIVKRGGLFVATAAVCVVLLSATTVVKAESNVADSIATSLRGGRRSLISTDENGYYAESIINSRHLEGEEEEEEEEEQADGEDEKQEEEEQQYQEGNNDGDEEQNEEEAEQEQQEQQEEENEDENEDNASNDEGDMNDDENANDDQSDFYTNVQGTVSDAQDQFSDLMDRFDEDVTNMWSTSPSEWDDEFWKVFGIVAGVFTLLLSCILYICCLGCSGDRDDITKYEYTGKRAKKKLNHRGRLFNRMRTNDDDTVRTNHTGLTNGNSERPFVLIEDIEKDDIKVVEGLTSPVYARGSQSFTQHDDISHINDASTLALEHPAGKSMSIDDCDTQFSTGTGIMPTRKITKAPSGGIINETVDVWSEFLGFKKSKYKMKPAVISKDEDDDILLTDDDVPRRQKRRSSSSKSRNSRNSSRSQMVTGTYSNPKPESEVENNPSTVSDDVFLASSTSASKTADSEKLTVKTPVMSNLMGQAARSRSPRRTALLKTKNLLKSIGNKNKGKSTNPRAESLLSKSELSDSA